MDKTNLYKALELAVQPGACLYVYGGKPCCIIGQLYVLEGGKVKDMLSVKHKLGEWSTVNHVYEDIAPPQLTKYPKQLLIEMQKKWDEVKGVVYPVEDRRAAIKQIIDEA